MPDQPDETPETRTVDVETMLQLMRSGPLEVRGLLPWSSNYTFLGEIADPVQSAAALVVYKPQKGERPLWDFPQGTLYKREAAAFLISAALGWDLVPPTVLRDGPHGVGSVQLFIEADYEQHYFTLKDDHADQFQRMALFDVVINNADRKGGHVLLGSDGRIWAIDHGIAFHDEYKLRTVIWEWVGQPIPEAERADLARLQAELADDHPLADALAKLLYPREIKAMRSRLDRLLKNGKFPGPSGQRSMPWPPV
jgi:uncharacterized repeat protein (TIGR03843 family)